MKSVSLLSVLMIGLLVLGGCEKPSSTSSSSSHGSAKAVPGSHDDWCGEHGVPESQCTRCNPELIPAFKATKDWCPEHGLPESQCTICHPDLKIVRPTPKAN